MSFQLGCGRVERLTVGADRDKQVVGRGFLHRRGIEAETLVDLHVERRGHGHDGSSDTLAGGDSLTDLHEDHRIAVDATSRTRPGYS